MDERLASADAAFVGRLVAVRGTTYEFEVDQQVKGEHASLDISPGRYRFVSEELPCDGNCGLLDPGTDGCSEEFVVESGKQLTATVTLRPTQGCTIEFGT